MNGMNMGAQQHESNVIHIENAKHEGIKTPEMICEQVESVVSDFVKKTNKDFFVIAAIKNNNISVELFKKKYDEQNIEIEPKHMFNGYSGSLSLELKDDESIEQHIIDSSIQAMTYWLENPNENDNRLEYNQQVEERKAA